MITKLVIRNFKAIDSLEVPLRPFTVLVGPNDAGKSTILQALEIVSRAMTGVTESSSPLIFEESIERYFPFGDRSRQIQFELHGIWKLGGEETLAPARPYRYELAFSGPPARVASETLVVDGKVDHEQHTFATRTILSGRDGAVADMRAELSSFAVRFDPRKLTLPYPIGMELAGDGSGLVSLIDTMLTAEKQRGADMQDQLSRFAPNVNPSGLLTKPTADRQKELFFSVSNRKTPVSAKQMSDGVVLVTAFLALRYGTSYRRYLVEEPENGIHPRAVATVVRLLQELALSGDRQVIATTHSPLLLNHVEAEDVLIVTRNAAGVRVTPMTETADFAGRARDFKDTGELWYNIGERELVRDAK